MKAHLNCDKHGQWAFARAMAAFRLDPRFWVDHRISPGCGFRFHRGEYPPLGSNHGLAARPHGNSPIHWHSGNFRCAQAAAMGFAENCDPCCHHFAPDNFWHTQPDIAINRADCAKLFNRAKMDIDAMIISFPPCGKQNKPP